MNMEKFLSHATILNGLSRAELFEYSLREGAQLTNTGALLIHTNRTGRSADDKFLVDTAEVHNDIAWGKVNKPMQENIFFNLLKRVGAYMQGKTLYSQVLSAGADMHHTKNFKIITEKAVHSLFAEQLLRPGTQKDPDFTILMVSGFKPHPAIDNTNSNAVISINFTAKLAIIAGTEYSGELKKTVFTIMNYLLPKEGVLPLHCSANADSDTRETILFLGLSGTGKTTLSASPDRMLIGDDEHGWSGDNIFNIEGGCYAKILGLTPSKEPEIYHATNKFCSIIENATFYPGTRDINFLDSSITENTRVGYDISKIPNSVKSGVGNIPSAVIFLTADAYGVLPPVARLSSNAAAFYFMSGYTSKMPGTEVGISEPIATFSSLFGEPFMPLKAEVYANMFIEKLNKHKIPVFLVNTGWVGDSGNRIDLSVTRDIIQSITDNSVMTLKFQHNSKFNLEVPTNMWVEYMPQKAWSSTEKYEEAAQKLARLFVQNFRNKFPEATEILRFGPKI